MNNWQNYKLGDICSIKGGKRLPAGHELTSIQTKHPYIKARDIRNGKIATANLEFISEITHNLISRYIVRANDVCITIVANIGDAGIVPAELDNANLTENALRLTSFKNNIDPKFLCYVLSSKTYKSYCESLAAGAAQAKLGIYKVKTINILLPPLPEQQRIASILSAYDDLIKNNNKRIALLEQMAEQIYKEWFVRMRFPGYENAEFEKGVPKWKISKLNKIVFFTKGKNPSLLFEEHKEGSLLYLNIEALDSGMETFCFPERSVIVKEGETLMLMDGARSGLIFKSRNGILGSTLSVIREKESFEIYKLFVSYFLQQNFNWIASNNVGSAIPHANRKFIERMDLFVPPKELVNKFNAIVTPIKNQIENLITQNKILKQTRDLLLPRLISGKLRVKEIKEAQLSKAEV